MPAPWCRSPTWPGPHRTRTPARRREVSTTSSPPQTNVRRSADRLRDWTWARSRLRSRLQVKWDPPWELLARSVDVQTNRIVALDHPAGCAPVSIDHAERWGVDTDEIWETAIAQSIGQTGIRRYAVDAGVHRFEGGLFTSGITSDLRRRLPEPLGHLGALVTCPTARVTYVNPLCRPRRPSDVDRSPSAPRRSPSRDRAEPDHDERALVPQPRTLESAVALTRRREFHLGVRPNRSSPSSTSETRRRPPGECTGRRVTTRAALG